jgi:hypothetical protein
MQKRLSSLLQAGPGEILPILPAPPRADAVPSVPQDELLSADSRRLFEAWQHWRGDRLLPHRADMDLVAISRLMPRLVVIDVKAPDAAIFRLAGTEIEQHIGQRLTGRSYIRMVPPERQQARGERTWRIATQPCAVLHHVACDWLSGQHSLLEAFGVPVLPDRAGEPVQILGVISRLPAPVWGRAEHITAMRSIALRLIDIGAGLPVLGASGSTG